SPRPLGAQSQALHFSYEKAGLTLQNQPIPWNAEAVVVEAIVRASAPLSRSREVLSAEARSEYFLEMAGREPLRAETLRTGEIDGQARVFFRLAVPARTVLANVRWRERSLGQ